MKKKILALVLTAAMVACFTGCGSSGSSADTSADTDTDTSEEADAGEEAEDSEEAEEVAETSGEVPTITVILKNSTTPFFISMIEGAEAAGEDLGVNVEVKTPTDTDAGVGNEQQTQFCEEAIVSGSDCVAIAPVDTSAIVPAIQKLVDAGIPVIASNTAIGDNSLAEAFVGLDNVTQGYDTAKALFEAMGGSGTLIIIEGTTGAQTSIDRVAGCMQALEEYPDIELLASQSGNYSRAEAMNVTQNLLQSYPDVDAIFCCNDEMALGTIEAVDAAGKTGEIMISGQDANDDAISAMKEGKMTMTSYGNPYMQAYRSVEVAVDLLNGEEIDSVYTIDTTVVTMDNIDTYNQ